MIKSTDKIYNIGKANVTTHNKLKLKFLISH